MGIFSTIGDFFSSGPSTYSIDTDVPYPQPKPAVPEDFGGQPINTASTGGGFFDSAAKLGDIFGKAVTTFYGAKSQAAQLKTATELEKIKLKAVTSSARQAPAAAQVILPTFSDWLNNPSEAASRVTPAALAGSGAIQGGITFTTIALVLGAVYLAKKG